MRSVSVIGCVLRRLAGAPYATVAIVVARTRPWEQAEISTTIATAAPARTALDNHLRHARWANTAFFLLLGIVFGSWVARIPAVQNRLGLSDGQLGVALLSVTVGAMLAMPATEWLIHRRGNAGVMRAAAVVLCLALPLLPLAPSLPALMLALFVFGVGFGLLDVSMNTHTVAVETAYARPIMSTFHGVFSVGGLAGSASAGVIAALGVPPVPHLLGVAALSLAVPLLGGRWLLHASSNAEGAPVFAIPPRSMLGLGVLSFCVLLGEGAIADWSAVYLENSLGSTAAVAAAGYAAFSLAMAGMRFGGDALTLRLGPVKMVFLGGLVAGVGLGFGLLVGTVPAAIVGFGCVGAGLAASFPLALGAAGRTPGLASGTAIGAVATAGYTGFLVGAPLIGFLAEYSV
jgi:Na+/melibiose symporter-like transporter